MKDFFKEFLNSKLFIGTIILIIFGFIARLFGYCLIWGDADYQCTGSIKEIVGIPVGIMLIILVYSTVEYIIKNSRIYQKYVDWENKRKINAEIKAEAYRKLPMKTKVIDSLKRIFKIVAFFTLILIVYFVYFLITSDY